MMMGISFLYIGFMFFKPVRFSFQERQADRFQPFITPNLHLYDEISGDWLQLSSLEYCQHDKYTVETHHDSSLHVFGSMQQIK